MSGDGRSEDWLTPRRIEDDHFVCLILLASAKQSRATHRSQIQPYTPCQCADEEYEIILTWVVEAIDHSLPLSSIHVAREFVIV